MSFLLALSSGTTFAQESAPKPARGETTWPGLTRAGTVLLPNGWSLRPAGRQAKLGDFPVAIAEHPSEPVLAVLHAGYGEHEVVTLDAGSGKVIARVALKESFQGLVWSSDGKQLFVGGGWDDVIYRFDHAGGLLSDRFEIKYPPKLDGGRRVPAGLALSGNGETLWVANAFGHTLAKFNGGGKLLAELDLGEDSYPYGLAWDQITGRLYVSLWNKAEVAVVDSDKREVIAHWATQEHPNELILSKGGTVLYVANANRNTVSVFDAKAGKAVETIGTAIDPNAPPGSTPSSLALTPDEELLFVANANTNDVAVFNVKELGESKPLGFIPAGWYPTSVRVALGGKTLYIANGKGTSSKANREGPNPLAQRNAGVREYIAGLFQGSLSILPVPGPREMLAYSKTVYECSPLRARATEPTPARAAGHPVPAQDRRPLAHQVLRVHHQGEPDLRPGLRRPPRRQRREGPLPLPRGGHAQPPRPGQGVRPARQLLRRGRGQRRRPRMVDGRLCVRLRREDLAALVPRATAGSPTLPKGRWPSPGRPAATSGIGPRRRDFRIGATASSSRTAGPPTTPRPPTSRPSRDTSTRSSGATTSRIPT